MKRTSTKKGIERRKKKRGTTSLSQVAQTSKTSVPTYACQFCGTALEQEDRALFVEEEIGRIFCSEDCISKFFAPEVERLEKGFQRRFSANDLTAQERESFAHLRWITLQEPDEIWREKTLTGDFRYTLISEFMPASKPVWSVCICLFLRGEPSFLFLSFVTKNPALANYYRRGERVEKVRSVEGKANDFSSKGGQSAFLAQNGVDSEESISQVQAPSDRLASAWTADETYLAQVNQERSKNDIPQEEFDLYHSFLEETLESPSELWTLQLGKKEPIRIFHFIRHYPEEKPSGIWYVIIAKESDQEDQIEIIDAFPTRDATLVNRYRIGDQELGIGLSEGSSSRLVH